MFWPREVVERDHEIQNPTSTDKIRLLGEYLRLTPRSRVLDVACGKGGPARILASTFGCHVTGVEIRPAFAEEARSRAEAEGLEALIDVQIADAATVELEQEAFDAALCLGASFVWGTMVEAAPALAGYVPAGGGVAIGEPFWRQWPLPDEIDAQGYVGLEETADRFEQAGIRITALIAASEDDWDRYESLHWRAGEEWLADHPEHESAGEFRAQHERYRRDYFRHERALLGWAIFVGRKA